MLTADLTRDAAGYTVGLAYLPTLADPACACVAVHAGAVCIGAVTVPVDVALDVYRHAAIYVPAYREALTARPSIESGDDQCP